MKSRKISLPVIVSIAIALEGCSINPYRDVDIATYKYDTNKGKGCECSTSKVDAIKYARWVQGQYKDEISDKALFVNISNITLLQLGLATIGLGAAGVSGDEILITGLSASSLYGTASLLRSNPVDMAYVAGMKAIQCAVDAVEPITLMDFSVKLKEKNGTETTVTSGVIVNDIKEFEASRNELISLVRLHKAGDQVVSNAEDEGLIKKANELIKEIQILENRKNGINEKLINSVSKISIQVDQAIARNVPDVAGVLNILSGLGAIYSSFTTIPTTLSNNDESSTNNFTGFTKGKKLDDEAEIFFRKKLEKYNKSKSKLSVDVSVLQSKVDLIKGVEFAEELKGCGIDTNKLNTELKVEPEGPIVMTAGTASVQTFKIKGGIAPYGVQFLSEANHLSLTQVVPLGSVFTIESAKEVMEGNHSVLIVDSKGNIKTLDIKVSGAAMK